MDTGMNDTIDPRLQLRPSEPEFPDSWRHKGVLYQRCSLVSKNRTGRTSSWWYHGATYALAETPSTIAGWMCGRCKSFVTTPKGAVFVVSRHMKEVHRLRDSADDNESEGSSQRTSTAACSIPPEKAGFKTLYHTVDVRKVQDCLLRWFIEDHIPFYKIDSRAFRRLMKCCSPSLAVVPMGRDSLRNWTKEEFEKEKSKVKILLQRAPSKVHLSFDLWTSPNGYAILAVVAHCVIQDQEGFSGQALLLASKRMRQNHTAKDIATVLISVILDYEIGHKLGVFIADNPDTNDNAIKYTLEVIDPAEKNPESRRSRCIGLIIGLAAKDFIFGDDVEAFEYDIAGEDSTQRFDSVKATKAQDAWRRKGAIGKLHNVVVFIRSSPQRREAFKRIKIGLDNVDELMPIQDNTTRWNSHYSSIERAIKLRARIDTFSGQYRRELQRDTLSPNDWGHLEEILVALKPFYLTTKELQSNAGKGRHGSVWEWLPTIEALISHTREGQAQMIQKYGRDHPLVVAYQNAWQKLDKYWNKSDQSQTIYVAATLFSPLCRKTYFDRCWEKGWTENMVVTVRDYYQKNYRGREDRRRAERPAEDLTPLQVRLGLGPSIRHDGDAFAQYISEQPIQYRLDIFNWWATASGFPELRQMAFDLISIPAMSAEAERVFSSAKKLLTPERNALSVESLEIYEVLRNWWLHDIVLQQPNRAEDDEVNTDEEDPPPASGMVDTLLGAALLLT